ncbi:MAG: Protein of unknown function (DUF2281) [Phormidesmis priestleyi Ana]|uniref:Uncharacterized protein n=1 Tax=Phormidesmis priestleyi Ana TaxID=1666911 RepID=A0A0P7YZR5_9CYAN|nr:MAG: Protein of unknown function (DUF2281) [Phormidesmis priestleyi Ana]
MNTSTDLRKRAQWILDRLPIEVLQSVVNLLEAFWQELTPKSELTEQNQPKTYDFSDLAGQLEWKGDAIKAQRALRNEW